MNARPIEIIAKNTKPTIMLQLDVGTCLEADRTQSPGFVQIRGEFVRCIARIGRRTGEGICILFGEALRTGKTFFGGCEGAGGVDTTCEQEGSRFSELDTPEVPRGVRARHPN